MKAWVGEASPGGWEGTGGGQRAEAGSMRSLGLGAAGGPGQEETGPAVRGGRPGGKIPTDLEGLHSAAPSMCVPGLEGVITRG